MPVCRVGRAPDPFAPPDWAYARADGTFGNRFDDPSGRWGVFADRLQHESGFVTTIQLTDSAVLDAAAHLGLEIELPDGSRLRP